MGYRTCLEKAGAKILDFAYFGSYQGDWLAFVEYNGEKGIVHGCYGSCSGCDAFQAEFGWNEEPTIFEGKFYKNDNTWDEDSQCTEEEYNQAIKDYDQKMADFGMTYLRPGLYDKAYFERRLKNLDSEDWFDMEEKEYIEWALDRNWE